MNGENVIYHCDACGGRFLFGPHVYNGTYLGELDAMICRACGPNDAWDRERAVARLQGNLGLSDRQEKKPVKR